VLRRYAAAASITAREARLALDDFRSLDIARYGHEMLLPRIWELRTNVTAYDAAYLALAELLRAPLLTCDARLTRAPGHRADVETVDSPP
jgi:predicted nucleic acid-binding protein